MAKDRNRRRMNPKLKAVLTFLTVLCLGIGVGLMFTPMFHIEGVFCEGNIRLSQEELCAPAQESIGKNIFLVRLSDLRKKVEEIPMVEKASIRRVFPNQIKITVEECIPAGYFYTDNQCVLSDIEGKILEVINDERVDGMRKAYIPASRQEQEEKEEVETPTPSEEPEPSAPPEEPEEEHTEPSPVLEEMRAHSVPLVLGVELHKPEVGKRLESKDNKGLERATAILRNLEDAGLLVRCTLVDLRDLNDVVLMVENRLEIQLGAPDNMAYRSAFLAKVIDERIAKSEHAVMDYRNADIYVRPPEDGKERMEPTATPEPTASEKPQKTAEKGTTSPTETPTPSSTAAVGLEM